MLLIEPGRAQGAASGGGAACGAQPGRRRGKSVRAHAKGVPVTVGVGEGRRRRLSVKVSWGKQGGVHGSWRRSATNQPKRGCGDNG
jgi:hypothetical protein